MSKKTIPNVTMRVRVGDSELEASGPQDFVETKIADFLKKQQKTIRGESGKTLTRKIGILATGKKLSVAQFFRKLATQTDVDRALAAGYYLERYENLENFTALEVKEKIRAAKINPPKNTNNSIDLNIKKGLIMPAGDKEGRRAFVLTSDGEDAISDMLKE